MDTETNSLIRGLFEADAELRERLDSQLRIITDEQRRLAALEKSNAELRERVDLIAKNAQVDHSELRRDLLEILASMRAIRGRVEERDAYHQEAENALHARMGKLEQRVLPGTEEKRPAHEADRAEASHLADRQDGPLRRWRLHRFHKNGLWVECGLTSLGANGCDNSVEHMEVVTPWSERMRWEHGHRALDCSTLWCSDPLCDEVRPFWQAAERRTVLVMEGKLKGGA